MAKKIVNVSYKVDDSELQKAKVTIQQVAAETKKSEVAMTQYQQAVTKNGTVIANTFAGQKLQMEQLRAQIDLTKQSDTARLAKLKSDYQEVKSKVDEFNKSLDQTKNSGQENLNVFKSLQNTLIAVFSVAIVKQAFSLNLEMNRLAGNVEVVDKAFKRAFSNADILLIGLRKSTHGVITDFELMKQAIQAQNLGIPIQHLGQLLEFAATRAQQTGQSVDYLVDSIVKGIGRKSILFFDQLGISTTRLKEEMGGVAIKSQDVADVSAAVFKVAGEELRKMGGYAETSATEVSKLEVAWSNLKLTVSKKLANSGGIEFLTSATDFIRQLFLTPEELGRENVLELANKNIEKIISNSKITKQEIGNEIEARVRNIKSLKEELAVLSEKSILGFTKGSPADIEQKQIEIAAQREAIRLIREYGKSLEVVKKPEVESIGIIQAMTDKIDGLNEALKKASSQGEIQKIIKDIKVAETELKNIQLPRLADPTDAENNARDAAQEEKEYLQIMAESQDEVVKSQEDFDKKLLDGKKDFEDKQKKIEEDAAKERQEQSDRERKKIIDDIERHNRQKQQLQKFKGK